MNKRNLYTIAIALVISSAVEKSQAQTVTSVANGNWNTNSTWSTNAVPAGTANITVSNNVTANANVSMSNSGTLLVSGTLLNTGTAVALTASNNTQITINGNTTFLGALTLSNNATVTINNGATLTVGSAVFSNNAIIVVNAGGTLISNGNGTMSNNTIITDNGTIKVNGNITGSNSATINGSGSLQVTGTSSIPVNNLMTPQTWILNGSTLTYTGNVAVGENLTVAGTSNLTGAVTTGSLTSGATKVSSLNSTGNITDNGNLTVSGTTNLTGAVTTGSLTSGATTVSSLKNTGNENVASLNVTGNTTLAGTMQNSSLAGTGSRILQTDANGNITPFPYGPSSTVLYGNGMWGALPAVPNTFWNGLSNNSITYNGTVGINNLIAGTFTPNTAYALDINGDAHVSNLYADQSVVIGSANVVNSLGAGKVNSDTLYTTASNAKIAVLQNVAAERDVNVAGNINGSSALNVTGQATFANSVDVGQNLTFKGGQAGIGYVPSPSPVPTPSLNTGNIVLSANTNVWGGLNVSSLAATTGGYQQLYVDSLGNLSAGANQRGGNTTNITTLVPCSPGNPAWLLGGNSLTNFLGQTITNALIGTCDNNPFKMETYGIERMRIAEGGNVGIGTMSPAAQLDITATGSNAGLNISNSTGSIFNVANNGNVNFLPTGQLYFNGDQYHGLGVYGTSGNTAQFGSGSKTINGPVLYGFGGGALGYNNGTQNVVLQWASTNGGQVFIGAQTQTSGPHASAMLQVNGDMVVGDNGGVSGIYLYQQSWSDFVFDKNYKLMPLSDVEKFYKENHHLPDVPTTKEIQENGNNLGQTDAVLLQKIEELTLYMVKQQKEIEELKKQVQQNKK